jgi:protein farnesyltransferase/geranylgeranyltransferase type-1 subunit alpha
MQPNAQELQHEINFIHNSLLPDTKNYHTWAYLNWLYSHFSNLPETQGGNRFSEESWARELEWCNNMLDSAFQFRGSELAVKEEDNEKPQNDASPEDDEEEAGAVLGRGDGRNNSAWSWRWHLVIARKGANPDPGMEIE